MPSCALASTLGAPASSRACVSEGSPEKARGRESIAVLSIRVHADRRVWPSLRRARALREAWPLWRAIACFRRAPFSPRAPPMCACPHPIPRFMRPPQIICSAPAYLVKTLPCAKRAPCLGLPIMVNSQYNKGESHGPTYAQIHFGPKRGPYLL